MDVAGYPFDASAIVRSSFTIMVVCVLLWNPYMFPLLPLLRICFVYEFSPTFHFS